MSTQQMVNEHTSAKRIRFEDPPIAKTLLGDVHWAWIWLILRLYVGSVDPNSRPDRFYILT
jgi:hypothetical protein